MDFVYVSFSLKSFECALDDSKDLYDKDYKQVYAPLIKFLFSHPDFKFSLSFSGPQIEYFKKRKNELITVCKSMLERNQIELIGGGYYSPILPLLYPVDRNGQIDMLSTEIRQSFAKRPRGASLYADSWDSSLINSLSTCGIEYVFLDSNIIPSSKLKYLPLFMSDFGKSIDIFPTYSEFIPNKKTEVIDFVQNIVKLSEKMDKKDTYFQSSPDRIINISLSHKDIEELLETKWFDKLSSYLNSIPDCKLKLTNVNEFRAKKQHKVPVYLNSGLNHKVAKWVPSAYKESDGRFNSSVSIYDFMETYPQSKALYNRMLYIGMMVNQFKGDKMRKKSAREKLWQAQNGAGMIFSTEGVHYNAQAHQQCYRYLMDAEKILREDGNFKESILCFDYNSDGENEYVCRMDNYFSYISLLSGAIYELDVLKNAGNYADNLHRIEKFDGCEDDYFRGIFVDHLFNEVQFESYVNGLPSGDGVFSKVQYSELKFSRHHNEVQLCANAYFGASKQPVYLRKKYIINSTGMNVQYIIKNLSDKPLNAKFAVESNFSHPAYDKDNVTYFNVEIADCEFVRVVDGKKSTVDLYKKGKLKNVDVVRLTDNENGISFAFEPNENCGYHFTPMSFKRPDYNSDSPLPVQMSFVSTLYWDINIEPGKDTEKNINFTILTLKKDKKSK